MTREEALKKAINIVMYFEAHFAKSKEAREEAAKIIEALEQELKTGRWIEHFDESGKWYECDQCHTDWGGSVNYCPNCGAKMKEGD